MVLKLEKLYKLLPVIYIAIFANMFSVHPYAKYISEYSIKNNQKIFMRLSCNILGRIETQ